jgi:hypothetical protein
MLLILRVKAALKPRAASYKITKSIAKKRAFSVVLEISPEGKKVEMHHHHKATSASFLHPTL